MSNTNFIPNTSNTLITQHLKKQFGKRIVVNDVCVRVNSGEIVGLLGPNGAGKTTIFYMIAGLIRPDQGHVLLNQHNITSASMSSRARLGIGYLPQETSIFRKLTVEQNIMAILQLQRHLDKTARQTRLMQLLNEFHLTPLRHHLATQLSGGEKRRVEIARALAANPTFILLDEPFAGIDPISVGEIITMIRDLAQKGIGILITDHNVRETLKLCHHAFIVSHGRIIAEGTADLILQNTTVRDVYLGKTFVL